MKKIATADGYVLKLNPRIYSLRVIYSCAHTFLNSAYLFLDGDPRKSIIVRIKAKEGKGSKRIADEFLNELLSASLRYQISTENRKIREAIIGSALFSVSENRKPVSNGCGCKDDVKKNRHAAINSGMTRQDRKGPSTESKEIKDPLGIGIPWEEKYGKDHKGKL
jgi:His-Xaa-Ser system protein HxsD